MKRKITALILTLGIAAGNVCFTGPAAHAVDLNGNQSSVTYKPVKQLYTGGECVKFFDAVASDWANVSSSTAHDETKSIEWLKKNGYLLNHFGRVTKGKLEKGVTSDGKWDTMIKGRRNTDYFEAAISFDDLTTKEGREDGNIANIYDKGDLEYLFSRKVYTVQTGHFWRGKSNDFAKTKVFAHTYCSSGNGWTYYSCTSKGPAIGNENEWKKAGSLRELVFIAQSDADDTLDAYMSGAMLVGKDVQGPKISSVRVTADIEGKIPIQGNAITLDTLENVLTNDTVYFRVQWDEPVAFKNDNGTYMSQSDVAKLSLKVNTLGADGTDGMIAEAPFLYFEPTKNDSKPVMVFEYKIQNPYESAGAQERGYYYKFKNVTVSSSENTDLMDHIYDISGNKFGADKQGEQPTEPVVTALSGDPFVDLRPFGIDNIDVSVSRTVSNVDSEAFIAAGAVMGVTFELNKPLAKGVSVMDLPSITLNVKDAEGNYVTISPSEEYVRRMSKSRETGAWEDCGRYWHNGQYIKPVMMLKDRPGMTYYIQLYPGYTMDGDYVKITGVTANKDKVKDAAGYSFMDYTLQGDILSPTDMPAGSESKLSEYQVSPNKQYKLDLDAPAIDVRTEDLGGGVIMIAAEASDISLTGTDASFTVKVNGSFAEEPMQYQASTSESYNDRSWTTADAGVTGAAFGSPVMVNADGVSGAAYGFIKLPQTGEADAIEISAAVTDEAGNGGVGSKTFTANEWMGYDTLAPRVKAAVNGEEISVEVSDIDENAVYSYGYSEDDTTEPAYTDVQAKAGVLDLPDLPEGNTVHSRVAWIRANDTAGNVSETIKLPIKFDRTYTDITYEAGSADTSSQYGPGEYPEVSAVVHNAARYWYMWAEKPAGTADTAAYIEDNCLDDIRSRAQERGQWAELTDGEPDTPGINNTTPIQTSLSGADVAKIDPAAEMYGENIAPDEATRPIMLIIAAEREDGTMLIRTAEFDTYYNAPAVSVGQRRFTTNDYKGKRVDYTTDGSGAKLFLAHETDTYGYPLNTPSLYGFAQAELRITEDPLTGLDRVDMDNSTVTLERVVYEGYDLSADVAARETLSTWTLSGLGLGENNSIAIADIDPQIIDVNYYEPYFAQDGDEYGNRRAVRYELVCNMTYTGGIAQTNTPIAYYAFNNTPMAYLDEIGHTADGYNNTANDLYSYENRNVEAVFDMNGSDITPNVPLYKATTLDYDGNEAAGMYIMFSTIGNRMDREWGDTAYYGAPVQNVIDASNTAKMALSIGTDPNSLTQIPFEIEYGSVKCEYDVSSHLLGDPNGVKEVKLYYRFEYPERGETSPLYVMRVRTDNEPPVFDISVSETERITNEVSVKLHSVYDVQTEPDGTVYLDMDEPVYPMSEDGIPMLTAWREATAEDDPDSIPDEDKLQAYISYDEETGTSIYKDYIRVYPDEDGIYRFTSNGFFDAVAEDYARNFNKTVLVNGKTADLEFAYQGSDFMSYIIDNIDNEPPQFVSGPTFTAADGKFSIGAAADDSVVRAYLRFDEAYSDLLAPDDVQEQDMYMIDGVPGLMTGGFNRETGEISAEIYVKYSDTVPLKTAALVIEDDAGNMTEYTYDFTALYGKQPMVTNDKNENGYPVWRYGSTLGFSVPVQLADAGDGYASSYSAVPIYSDGIAVIAYTDLFGTSYTESILADIYGAAFAHKLTFTAGGTEITPQTKVASDVTVSVDTSGTDGLSVDGGVSQFTLTDNGAVTYSLTNSGLGETRTYNVPVTNIDKTAPEAIVSVEIDSETDQDTGGVHIYSARYSIEGFSESGVEMIPNEDGSAPMNVSFDADSEAFTYTFKFRDEAGNEGSYTVDASETAFEKRADTAIAGYKLTYTSQNGAGVSLLGVFTAGETIDIGMVNNAVSVQVAALNKDGDTVPAAVTVNGELPSGAAVYADEVIFSAESGGDRTVSLTLTGDSNSIDVPVLLPADTIDITAPSGTVNYVTDGTAVKAYLVTADTDIAQVDVTGTKSDSTAFELKQDENGYYTEFDINGTGQFVMMDNAGNIGTVSIAVLTIDTDAPNILAEGWQSHLDARDEAAIKELLSTPTNSTIKLFITFDEQLSRAEVKAYSAMDETAELTPTDEYITAAASGNALTVEFKQNCTARLTVYDLRGNAMTIWRPEDGPITVIDRKAPKPAEGYPKRTVENNVVTIEYVFADGEEVMRLDDHESGYKNSHTVMFDENGANILTFADRAGNVYSDYPVITEVDDTAPRIKISVDQVGEGAELSPNDSYKAGNLYTNRNVRILLNVEDEKNEPVTVTAKTHSGKDLEVKAEAAELNGRSYNYNVIVTENGSYRVTAADKWGNETFVDASVSIIDRTAPTIRLAGSAVNVTTGTDSAELERKILAAVTAVDTQSGANAPMGDKLGEVNDGVSVSVDVSGVDLSKSGTYNAKVSASDRLGNTAERNVRVLVMKDLYMFDINGASVFAGDVFTTSKGRITIGDANDDAKYYYSKGYKTAAQMKYADTFEPEQGFDASQSGYYTILAHEGGRRMYLLYVYVN